MKNKGRVLSSIVVAFFVLTLLAATAFAVPQTISYQGRLADSGGVPVNGPVSITFSIYNASSGGSALWTETQGSVAVTDGAFSAVLGEVSPINLPFDEQYYLGVDVNSDGEMGPRAVLLSVPYSMRAKEADSADTADTADLLDGQDSTAFAASAHGHSGADITDGTVTGAKLSEPLSLSRSSGAPIVSSTNTGGGQAGSFQIMNSFSSNHALMASTNGFGSAVYGSTSGIGYAVYGYNTGMGRAGHFEINKSGNSQPALSAQTNGSGNAIYGLTTGSGYSGYFEGGSGVYVSGNLDVTGSITGDGSGLTGVPVGTHGHSGADITSGTVADARVASTITRDSEIMPTVLANDGPGSTLNADLLDGQNSTAFAASAHGHSGADITDGTVTGAKLSVPLTLIGSSSSNIVGASNTGTGEAGVFQINNAANGDPALVASTNGTGPSALFMGGPVVVWHDLSAYNISGNSFSGDGSGLTGVPVGTHNHDTDYVNATGDTMSGTLNVTQTGLTADAGHFEINNYSSGYYAVYAKTNGIGPAVYAQTTGTGHSGKFFGGQGVEIWGNLNVTGALSKGSGTFVQPHPTDPSKELVYAFFEGPEHAVFLRGTGRLVEGKAVIDTPEHFRAVAGEEGITVQFTPRFENTIGLAAVEVTKERIVVKERMGGKNTYEFDYFITAKRAGFEAHEPIQPNTHFTADMKTAEEFEEAYAKDDMTISAMRRLLVSNGILTADGKLNMDLAQELGWVVKDSDVAMKEAE